jgi:SAM-dependent methyltransferase
LINAAHASGPSETLDDAYPAYEFVDALHDLEQAPPRSILIIGCRLGYECRHFHRLWPEAEVVGVDIVPQFVEEASKHGSTLLADMHALPFDAGAFEWAFCSGTLEHAYNPALAAREMLRVASHGIYVTADLEPFPSTNASHWSCSQDPQEWERLFEAPGWRIMHREVEAKSLCLLLLRGDA